jgi:hypothetical protein
MAANDVILTRYPMEGDHVIGVKNTDGSNNLVPGQSCTLDAANLLSTTQPIIGVKQATADDVPFGVVLENIAMTKIGRIAVPFTGIVPAIASGAITANTNVEADTGGLFKTCGAGKPQYGVACTTTASSGDQFLLALGGGARNS